MYLSERRVWHGQGIKKRRKGERIMSAFSVSLLATYTVANSIIELIQLNHIIVLWEKSY